MTYTLDYDEPLRLVVKRLRVEHRKFEPILLQVGQQCRKGDLKVAVDELNEVKPQVLRHAVEEEARLMRVIMWEFKDKADESIIILRYHRRIADFFGRALPNLTKLDEKVTRREIGIFVKELLVHQREEEKVLFPLALKADSLYEKRNP